MMICTSDIVVSYFPESWHELQCTGTDEFCVIKSQSGLSFKDSPLLVSFQLDSIPVHLVPAAMEVPVRKRQGATDVCVLTGSLENTVKWVSAKPSVKFK